ncbi:hypothetical protein GJ904_19960 [Salmonella enterica]|nr:hypothetical protein [Salmonella enterica subsp. enterica serovar Saintpaul]EEC1303340.1 hypothetical protein [Salmonella enterica]
MKKLIASLLVLAASAGVVHAKSMAQEAAEEAAGNVEMMVGPTFGASALNMKEGTACKVKVSLEGGYVKDVEILSGDNSFCAVVSEKIYSLGHVGGMSNTPYAFVTSYSVYNDNVEETGATTAQEPVNAPTAKAPAQELPELEGTHYYCENGEKAIISTDTKTLRVIFNDGIQEMQKRNDKDVSENQTNYSNADTGAQIYRTDAKTMTINFGHGYDTECTKARN